MGALAAALADRYRIERELGQGGMATVYLAEDLRHKRRVAVKVLKPELAAMLGAERFVHEITTTASLQHPHILPLFDSGSADGFLYYVMPFIDGETLRGKLDRETQLGIDEAVRITASVADALDYAHRHGVIHRDIKPENILLHDGRPMVADFGIALALSAAAGGRMTETGLSLGTPHYMSPEQATAEKDLTSRSDIYSLGSVLYEMLTGDPPHTGASAQQIIMKIVTEEAPPVTRLRKAVPPNVAAAVSKAVEKLPADRFATAKDFADALTNPAWTRPSGEAGIVTTATGGHWKPLAIGATCAALALAATTLWAWRRPELPRPVTRFTITFPDSQVPQTMQLSEDGRRLVYPAPNSEGVVHLWVKERSRADPMPIAGTENPQGFRLSPDGEWLAYVQNRKVRTMRIGGGPVTTVADSVSIGGVAWLDDGTLIYTSLGFEVRSVPATGGAPTVLWKPPMVARAPVLYNPLPRGRGLLFTLCSAGCGEADLYAFDRRSGEAKLLIPDVLQAWHLPTGHLAYVTREAQLLVVPFDLEALETRGTANPALGGIGLFAGLIPNFAVSGTGTVIFERRSRTGGRVSGGRLVWVDRSGRSAPVDSAWTFDLQYGLGNNGWSLSPDGKLLAIGLTTESGEDVWIRELATGRLSRLTFDTAGEFRPRWSPDGRSVTYLSAADFTLRQRRADGSGGEEVLSRSGRIFEGFWATDGTSLVLRIGGETGAGRRDIVSARPGADAARPLAANPAFDESAAAISPDGKWLAYQSDETGTTQVFVRPFPETEGGKWQASATGGQAPLWAHSGRELFYVDPARNMVVVPVAGGATPGLGAPRVLFPLGVDLYLNDPEHYTPFDISPDDERFLMVQEAGAADGAPSTFVLIENWFEELP
jgi:serine/threonine-protein kinase